MVYNYNKNLKEYERATSILVMWGNLYNIICTIQEELKKENPNFNKIEYLDLGFGGKIKKIYNYKKLSVYKLYLQLFSNLDHKGRIVEYKIACQRKLKV